MLFFNPLSSGNWLARLISLMAKIIPINKKEKLAILRILIDINNHYSTLFSKESFSIIQKASIFFNLPNGISEAYNMSITDAKHVLKEFLNDLNIVDSDSKYFFTNLLGKLLETSKKGAINEAIIIKQKYNKKHDDIACLYLKDEYDEDKFNKYIEELDKLCDEEVDSLNALTSNFKKEWSYIFKLLDIPNYSYSYFAYKLLEFDSSSLDSNAWIVIDKIEDNFKIAKEVEINPTNLVQDTIKTDCKKESCFHSNEESIQVPHKKITPYSDVINEILYKDL